MIKKLLLKINSLIGTTSGYKGIIFVNFCILVLVLGLMFVQYNWISKEKKKLKSMIDRQSEEKETRKFSNLESYKKLPKKAADDKKQLDVSNKFSEHATVTKYNVKNIIKKADMYFDYEQYNKAVGVYEKLIGSEISIDESDRIITRLADSYYKLERYDKASVLYRNVSNNYLNSSYRLSAQLNLGNCLILTGDYRGARRVLYSLAGLEAKYTEDKYKQIIIEAHYKIADSYIAQAKHFLKKEDARHNTVAIH